MSASGSEGPGGGDVIHVVARPLAPGPGLTVARDGAVHELRIEDRQGLEIDTEALRHAGPEALDGDVGVRRQLLDDLRRLGVLQVEREAALVAVLHAELHRHVAAAGIAARRLDLDHVGPQVGEDRRGERPGDEHGEVDDADA
jgi:hypothetical protein